MKQPPSPPSAGLLGHLRPFADDILGYHEACAREYGEIVRLRLAHRTVYMINSPALINDVLVARHRDFIKHSLFWRNVTAIFGTGLLTNEGDSWLRQRRLAAPAFHRERVAGYAQTMVAYTERMLDGWSPGETRNAHQDMMGVTLEIVAKALFDTDVSSDVQAVGTAFDAVTDEIAVRFRRPVRIPDWVPLPGNIRYTRGVRALDALVYRIIAEHRANGAQGSDLLSMLMNARDEDGGQMNDRQLRDEAVTLLLAGHETTALVLSWAWDLIGRNPQVERKLVAEVNEVLGDRPPTVTDLPRLRYFEWTVLESMRLRPPAYGFGREAARDTRIGEYAIAKGQTVFMSPWTLHRDPQYFEDPLAFRPERWADGLADRLPRHQYMPFGGGPRICIGNSFAMMEAVLLLATIARRYQLVPLGPLAQPFPTITLRPTGGVSVRVMARPA